MSTITNRKRMELRRLGYIKRLPMAFAPTFYQKVSELLAGVETEELVDSIAVFSDITTEMVNAVNATMPYDATEEAYREYLRCRAFYRATGSLFYAYSKSPVEAENVLGRKALALWNKVKDEPARRTNVAALMMSLADNISRAWTAQELTGTFLEGWKSSLTTCATRYAGLYQRRVEAAAERTFFTDYVENAFEAFQFLYYNIYTYVGNTGDVQIAEAFAEINDLIDTYTAIYKGRMTRIANRRAANTDDNTDVEDNAGNTATGGEVDDLDEEMESEEMETDLESGFNDEE